MTTLAICLGLANAAGLYALNKKVDRVAAMEAKLEELLVKYNRIRGRV